MLETDHEGIAYMSVPDICMTLETSRSVIGIYIYTYIINLIYSINYYHKFMSKISMANWRIPTKPEPNMIKILPIIPSSTSLTS